MFVRYDGKEREVKGTQKKFAVVASTGFRSRVSIPLSNYGMIYSRTKYSLHKAQLALVGSGAHCQCTLKSLSPGEVIITDSNTLALFLL